MWINGLGLTVLTEVAPLYISCLCLHALTFPNSFTVGGISPGFTTWRGFSGNLKYLLDLKKKIIVMSQTDTGNSCRLSTAEL